MESPEEVIAAAMWNIGQGYSPADKIAVGKSPFEWIGAEDQHPDDVRDRELYLAHARDALAYLRETGWEFRRARLSE